MRKFAASCCRTALLLTLLCAVSGCQQTSYRLDTRHRATNQDSRARFLILHYTGMDETGSLHTLTAAESGVSAHYLVGLPQAHHPVTVYALVAETARAWHAGRSGWGEEQSLNAASIGIELVNEGPLGPLNDDDWCAGQWAPWPDAQIRALAELIQPLLARQQIPPSRVLGHSDIAPGRKIDPGARFPWRQLHDQFGIGRWPDETAVADYLRAHPSPPDPQQLLADLQRFGYALNGDATSRRLIQAFQLHFRPARCDGRPDAETMARLQILLQQP